MTRRIDKPRKTLVLASVAAVMAVAIGVFATVRLQDHKPPSSELLMLREVEASLALPKPAARSEDDSGCNRDGKGASHFTRYILIYYDNLDTAKQAVAAMQAAQWESVPTESYSVGETRYDFVSKVQKATVSIDLNPNSTDRLPHNIFIEPLSTDVVERCPQYFGEP